MSDYTSVNKDLDWTKARVIAAGVDSGAVGSKAVILLDGEPYACSRVRTRIPRQSAQRALEAALAETALPPDRIHFLAATGRGRTQVPLAGKTITEIACAAAGAVRMWGPSVRTVLDAGGESCRVIQCTEKGRATAFLWNDKCAAGIGRYMETFADLAQKDLAELAEISSRYEKFPKLSNFCAVYAQSEALDLLRDKVASDEVVAAYHSAMAERIGTLLSRSGIRGDLVVMGGLAKNTGIMDRVEGLLKVSRLPPQWNWDPELGVALGAAVFADAFHRREQSGS